MQTNRGATENPNQSGRDLKSHSDFAKVYLSR